MEGIFMTGDRTLSDADMDAISSAVVSKIPQCSLGLSQHDAVIIKGFIKQWNSGVNIISKLILTTLAVIVIGVFTKGFWVAMVDGIRLRWG